MDKLTRTEVKWIVYSVLLLTVAYAGYTSDGGFVLFLYVTSYVLILRVSFQNVYRNASVLLGQITVIQRCPSLNPKHFPVWEKLHIFKTLRVW